MAQRNQRKVKDVGDDAFEGNLERQIVSLLGEDTAFKLFEAYAGTRLHVPTVGGAKRSSLSHIMGLQAALKMTSHFGEQSVIRIPLCREFRALRYFHSGATNRDVALHLGLHLTSVEKMRRRLREKR